MQSSRRRPLLSPTEREEMALQNPDSPEAMQERGRRLRMKAIGTMLDVRAVPQTADEVLDALFWQGLGEAA